MNDNKNGALKNIIDKVDGELYNSPTMHGQTLTQQVNEIFAEASGLGIAKSGFGTKGKKYGTKPSLDYYDKMDYH